MFEKSIEVREWVRVPYSEYRVNEHGNVLGPSGKLVPIEGIESEEDPQVFADLWDGLKQYLLLDVLAVTFKNVQLPVELLKEVEGFVIDGDIENLAPGNIGYRFRTQPLECFIWEGFFYIPMATQYGINHDGMVIGTQKGNILATRTMSASKNDKKNITGGYCAYSIPLDTGNYTSLGRHRALLLAFKPYPNNVDNLDSNHLDGIPGNDWLDNLEWSSRGRNLTHAYETGLRKQNRHVLVHHLRTGEEKEYWSICEAARALGLASDEGLRFRLGRPFGSVFQDGTQVKFSDDPRAWVIPDDIEQAIDEATQAKPIIVRNCHTGEEFECGSSTEVEAETGIPFSNVLARLRKDLRGPHRGYQWRYKDDLREWAAFDPEELDDTGSIARPVIARNILTQENRRFDSVRQCVVEHSPRNLVLRLRAGRHPLYPNGWQYKYDDETAWKDEDIKASIIENSDGAVARHIVTGEEREASSALTLGRLLDLNSQFVAKALLHQGKRHVKGWQVRTKGIKEPWPEINPLDIEILKSTQPSRKHTYYRLTHDTTQERHYFHNVRSAIAFLDTVHSVPVFHRLKRRGELLDGVYRCETIHTLDHLL